MRQSLCVESHSVCLAATPHSLSRCAAFPVRSLPQGRAPPGVSFGSASRTGPGSYAWDEAFADSNHRRALDDAIEADTLRTNRAIVAIRFGRTPGYNAALAGMDKAGHRAVTAEEAVRANVDPRALLLQPALRREVIAQKAREKKVRAYTRRPSCCCVEAKRFAACRHPLEVQVPGRTSLWMKLLAPL